MSVFDESGVRQPGTVDGVNCVDGPAGSGYKLKRYEIKSGNTFPSGRSYASELQNFANWYTYYRTRMQMMKSAPSSSSTRKSPRG